MMEYTSQEMMAIAAGREVRDGELAIFGVGLAMLAGFFALAHHAPRARAMTEGGEARRRHPFAGGGPSAIVTTLGILRPEARTREFVLCGYYPFTDIEAIRGQTGWELKAAPELAPVPEPSAAELDALRRVDVTQMLRKGSR